MTCEYSATFAHNSGGDASAVDAIFNKWLYNRIGSLPSATSYMRTAVFSNAVLGGAYEVVYPQTVQSGRYYQCVDTIIGGVPTKLVITHLDFGATGDGATYRAAQIQKLITDFANETHVIICGDFNVSSADEYNAFANAGYTMANHGYMGNVLTYPSSGTEVWGTGGTKTMYDAPASPLDNIIVKGFAMGNIRLIDNKELSDHCGVVCDLTLI
jgi:endonuclease/exonuclease/phosphatase family metal-dependent hydrolase